MALNRRTKRGNGLINKIINKLPIELHIPGYQYCGPGTKLSKRLARGDPGLNLLDKACKEHDIAYSKNRENLTARHEADRILQEKAWGRVSSKDAGFGEKASAWGVANVRKIETKLGVGLRKKKKNVTKVTKRRRSLVKRKKTCGGVVHKRVPLKKVIRAAKQLMRPGDAVKSALQAARDTVRKAGGKKFINSPPILPVPGKTGEILSFLIPSFAGLSATDALAGGAAGIATAVNDADAAKQYLAENERHNQSMETITMGKGLYLKPYRAGLGLYLESKSS